MFKIASLNTFQPLSTDPLAEDKENLSLLSRFCAVESWSGDLSTGLLQIGQKALFYHSLENGECGLLNLIRCYDPADRNNILELFEQATTHSSSFCFSTTISNGRGGKAQPLFCIGESSGMEKKFSGTISGVFLFPKFTLEPTHSVVSSIFNPH